ncbi:uncharacterized protein LOC121651102 isoform X2 [Melanotaenia boesemani]|uniref:uncharacterized protein LOC121651102 isoform X2 n=1 Tax=Melanotaenia boesemani TaxID=1250792 RepID=UPI001C04508B|nr:uncharacterized protein LOC121651102 isoform X2 [Melanotaenia boesemani]
MHIQASSLSRRKRPTMRNFPTNFPFQKVSVFVSIVVSFTYNVLLDRDVSCTCQPEADDCDTYMSLPFFIIFFLILWTDKTFHRNGRYLCTCKCAGSAPDERQNQPKVSCCRGRFLGEIISSVIKAALVGLLWVVSVLIDGDWFVCCKYNEIKYPQLACKGKTTLTAVERLEVNRLQNESRKIGLSVILGILVLATVMSVIRWWKCCAGRCCDRKVLYDRVIMEEEDGVLEKYLKTKAKDELTQKIQAGDLRTCFDAAEKLIDSDSTPRVPD